MSIVYGSLGGNTWFYDSTLGTTPDDGIVVSQSDYDKLFLAHSLGASIVVKQGKVVAVDYSGNMIDINHMTKDDNFHSPPTLATQASATLSAQKAYVSNEFLVFGLAVPEEWATYLKTLRAIADGTDTTSTALPVSPLNTAPVALTPAQKTAAALEALGEYLMEQQTKGFFFTPTGTEVAILFSTSSHAQSQYVGANSLARDNPTTSQNFITDSGAPIVLTADDVITLTNGVASYINDTNATYASLVAKVNADYTTDITVGWPDNKLP